MVAFFSSGEQVHVISTVSERVKDHTPSGLNRHAESPLFNSQKDIPKDLLIRSPFEDDSVSHSENDLVYCAQFRRRCGVSTKLSHIHIYCNQTTLSEKIAR